MQRLSVSIHYETAADDIVDMREFARAHEKMTDLGVSARPVNIGDGFPRLQRVQCQDIGPFLSRLPDGMTSRLMCHIDI